MANYSFDFLNKNILVTGASSGIGKQICIECAQAGANVILMGRDHERLTQTLNLMPGNGHIIIAGDIQDEIFIEETCKSIPSLDGFVHSAGLIKLIPLKFLKSTNIDEMLSINLRAPILFVSLLFKLKKLKPYSSIVLLSSITGAVIGSLANSIYGASKGGLHAFCKSAALELAKSNIRINCVAPGIVETEGVEKLEEQVSNESMEIDKKTYPLNRFGSTSEIAASCLFLLSDGSKWTTGTTLVIDGGLTAQ